MPRGTTLRWDHLGTSAPPGLSLAVGGRRSMAHCSPSSRECAYYPMRLLAVPHFVSCLAWLWHPAQLAAGQWDGPGVKHCAVRTTSGRYLTVISQSGVLQDAARLVTAHPPPYNR